jgi:DNA-directed RNA polymerase subunit beta'
VAGQDITQGLPRVEELFEARPVKRPAIISSVTGIASIADEGKGAKRITITHRAIEDTAYPHKKGKKVEVLVKEGEVVKAGQVLFAEGENKMKAKTDGLVKLQPNAVVIIAEKEKKSDHVIPPGQTVWVKEGDLVNKGDQLTDGSLDLHQLFYLKGQEAVQRYVIREIQYIYSSQGQKLNDKHIEIVVRQIFSRIYVKDPGGTSLLSGEIVERSKFIESNKEMVKKAGVEAQGEQLLLGITKVSLSIDSFLSAASFQETARVLIEAAVSGKVDNLRGLKENVIIGKLIPAGTGFRKV